VVVVAVWPLTLVKWLLLLVIVRVTLIVCVVLRAHETLRVFLMNNCHDLSANLGFRSFWDGVILESITIFIHVVRACLDVGIVNTDHRVDHTVVISLTIVFNWSHHAAFYLRVLVARSRPWVCHSPPLSFRKDIVQSIVKILLLVHNRLGDSWLHSSYYHRQMVLLSLVGTLQLVRPVR
jgi:hypothetical protein